MAQSVPAVIHRDWEKQRTIWVHLEFERRSREVAFSKAARVALPSFRATIHRARGAANGAATLWLAGLTQSLTLGTDHRFTCGSPLLDGFAMTLSAKKGEFSGLRLLGGEKTKFSGRLMQESDEGVGFSQGGDFRVELGE